jgi:hypothetical protein
MIAEDTECFVAFYKKGNMRDNFNGYISPKLYSLLDCSEIVVKNIEGHIVLERPTIDTIKRQKLTRARNYNGRTFGVSNLGITEGKYAVEQENEDQFILTLSPL